MPRPWLKIFTRNVDTQEVICLGAGKNAYQLKPLDACEAPSCYLYKKDAHVASLESMSIHGNTLLIGHFAVVGDLKGAGFGEDCLRTFASLVRQQEQTITEIEFELYRTTSSSDVVKLAQARTKLLQRLGATNITTSNGNTTKPVVKGRWMKEQW